MPHIASVRRGLCAGFIAVTLLIACGVARAEKISQEEWVGAFRILLPSEMCSRFPDALMKPYGLKLDQCMKHILRSLDLCLEFNRPLLPAMLDQPQDGQIWGTILGRCAGSVFDAVMTPRLGK